MGDIQRPGLLWMKFVLFLVLGLLASGMLFAQFPSPRPVVLHAIAIWAFCRAYYFAFYVIEKYVDPSYRFAGLTSFLAYAWRQFRRG